MDRVGEKSRFKTPRMFVREGALHTGDIIKRIQERFEGGASNPSNLTMAT
jgi:hypothetical protein